MRFFRLSFSTPFSACVFKRFLDSKIFTFYVEVDFWAFFRAPSKSRGGPLGAILPFQGGQNRAPLSHFRRFFDFGPFPRDVKISLIFHKFSDGSKTRKLLCLKVWVGHFGATWLQEAPKRAPRWLQNRSKIDQKSMILWGRKSRILRPLTHFRPFL